MSGIRCSRLFHCGQTFPKEHVPINASKRRVMAHTQIYIFLISIFVCRIFKFNLTKRFFFNNNIFGSVGGFELVQSPTIPFSNYTFMVTFDRVSKKVGNSE